LNGTVASDSTQAIAVVSSRSASGFQLGLLLLAVVLIIATTAYSTSMIGRVRGSVDWVTETLEAKASLQRLQAGVYNVEIYGLRFLISGRDEFLMAHLQATNEVAVQLRELAPRVLDNPERLAQLEELRALVRARDAFYRSAIGAAQLRELEDAVETEHADRGARMLERMQVLIAAMDDGEARLLGQRQQELDAAIVQTNVTLLLVNALALVLGAVALVSLRAGSRAAAAEELARVRASEAERVSREKSQFLASMSHEIRTPMNAVFGYSQLLARTRIEPQAREYIRAIQTSGNALLALINDILDLSRIESGRLELSPQCTDLRELIDSTLAVFGESAGRKGLKLRARIAPALPVGVWLDPHRLRQVLSNLISNAVKYTARGEVSVHAEAIPREAGVIDLRIEVRDDGPGIDAVDQVQVFEPFYRAADGAEAPQGTGLGLAIVRKLLALMDGAIELDTALGQGSVFRVLLDGVAISSGPGARGEGAGPEVDFGQLKPSRILIVDDVAWNRELLAAFLAEGEHQLEFAANGAQAIEVAARFRPELVLMDLRMPVLDGREAARRLRQWHAAELGAGHASQALAVIAVSASSMSREERAISTEFEAYVRKPVSREVLHAALLKLIGPASAAAPKAATQTHPETPTTTLDPVTRAEVQARLRAIVEHDLPPVLESLRVVEVHRLAVELTEQSRTLADASLLSLGLRLSSAVERFDVLQMESLLLQIPEHVEAASTGPAAAP
jgi:signal transduction histidine kinase/DNA-binding response OmpR family regulator